ncbi:hypothetical protein [Wielerella bovis]|uniref:hypothetical protein n=1 Tax=Wielerella bovis TaxID=2917790 RepID=UPI002019EE09|nr:hypothetical protein [Wielerella bovis]MCG7656553.1 hypothetical protein [Wielerella bovis]MCG7658778.1 hypothetical protein [Wielerella bovis]ULJ63057.1 hypothetical protein MIS46_03080 [Wielerella bovis]ULJ65288.1 hypothetical protein MIS33_03145 [Wielerella bovis]ULJ67635.1 hypothetical protein MIS31_03520 [Wielerella bovis]
MSHLDYAALFLMFGIILISLATVWQMYVMLTETYSLNRFQNSPKMLWVAMSLFFSFSLSVYWVCPNARKKGWLFLLLGGGGVVCYGLGMWYKKLAGF